MEYGFKKGHAKSKASKPVYVFIRKKFDGITEAAKETGVKRSSITFLAKAEREKNGFIFSFNENLGQIFSHT